MFSGGLNAASTLSVVIVVIYGANLTINGYMTTGSLTSFILYSLTGIVQFCGYCVTGPNDTIYYITSHLEVVTGHHVWYVLIFLNNYISCICSWVVSLCLVRTIHNCNESIGRKPTSISTSGPCFLNGKFRGQMPNKVCF